MNVRSLLFTATLLLALISANLVAGALGPGLNNQLSRMSGDQMVKVWIQLPQTATQAQINERAIQGATLAEQHRNAITALKSDHAASQSGVRLVLDSLVRLGNAQSIKQRWITNLIEAEISASELSNLADRQDIETIVLAPQIELIAPVDSGAVLPVNPNADVYTANLRRIRADVAHTAGYTGRGRLLCSFDTGVDGAHPALRTRWRGYNGSSVDSTAGWYDPVTGSNYPRTITGSLSPSHGTHVMGIMVGWDSVGSRMFGVAPDAKWISAAVIDATGASILDGFEWVADPDGDPNTIDDMPDVINHSWGFLRNWNYDVGCINLFFNAIDNIEALGIVNIFAAGNTGPGVGTIFNPANRANDSLDCFAVGNTDTTTNPKLSLSSSRGPSGCNGAKKPNVVAPGTAIYSTYPSGAYSYLSGTSMAAPHVAGLVALMRQKNPNATVRQIKQAILTSTNHFSWPIPNDSVGWGQIDCVSAINALPANPSAVNLRLYDFVHGTITPGATINGTLRIQNTGPVTANSVTVIVSGTHPSLTIYDGIAVIGNISAGAIGTSADQFSVKISDTVTAGSVIRVPLLITANGYSIAATLHFLVEPVSFESTATHNTGRIQFTLSNFGVMGMAPGSFIPLSGSGFRFEGGLNSLFEAGLMAANGSLNVVSGVHEYIWSYENDFKVSPGGNMQFNTPGAITDQQTYSIFTDSSSFAPIGVRFVQESFSESTPDNNFIIIRYIFTNLSGGLLNDFNIGLFLDWDVVTYNANAGGFHITDSVLWMALNTGSETTPVLTECRAARILYGPLSSGYTNLGSTMYPSAGGFTPAKKYTALTNDTLSASTYANGMREMFQVIAAGPFTMTAGQTDTVAFVLSAGANYAGARDAAFRAQQLYDSVIHGPYSDTPDDGSPLPYTFVLHQNYPNPFNSGTAIKFILPRASDYTLEIFDLLGRRVEQWSGRATAGTVKLSWEGEGAASGVYLYRVTAGELTASKKMVLLK